MRKFHLFLFLFSLFIPKIVTSDTFEEAVKLKSLPTGHIYSHFEFTTKVESLSDDTKLFPRTLAEILLAHQIQELHFSLTQGYWRLEWGEPVIAAPTGARVVAWFHSLNSQSADKNWNGFTSRLSGLTCASLNFLDVKSSIEPRFAYRPWGTIRESQNSNETAFVRVGNLPKENVCTENLTPWSKLLPCGLSRGLASLLRSKQVFNTHYHSAGIHVTQKEGEIILQLTLSLVFDPRSKLKPTDSIPRKVLGSLAIFPCQPTSKTTVHIWDTNEWKIYEGHVNLLDMDDLPPTPESVKNLIFKPVKYMGGYGQEYGTMIIEMTNYLSDQDLTVLYVEVLPWYIRPYFHTMKVDVNPGGKLSRQHGNMFHYTPGQDRKALHKLEMDFFIPAQSTVTLSFIVEKGHLKWNEYPPDANHGFYLEAAHFEVNISSPPSDSTTTVAGKTMNQQQQNPMYYYSRILLVNLSTPDFSMPYNVICLTCTVVALAFGPIHNITTKQLKLSVLSSRSDKTKQLKKKLLAFLLRRKEEPTEAKDEGDSSKEQQAQVNTIDSNIEEKAPDPPEKKRKKGGSKKDQ